MKRALGILLLIFIWGGVVFRNVFPSDLHGGYSRPLSLAISAVDLILIYPPVFLFSAIAGGAPEGLWFLILIIAWALLLNVVMYFLLLRPLKLRP